MHMHGSAQATASSGQRTDLDTKRVSPKLGPTLLLCWGLSLPDDLMGLGLDVPRVTAIHEHLERVKRGCG
jgi:hypothetical protein